MKGNVFKTTVVILSGAFAILGIIGVAAQMTPWLSWLALIGGVVGFIAGLMIRTSTTGGESFLALLEGIEAGVLWIVALATGHHSWMAWWTFVFGIAFIVTAVAGYSAERGFTRQHA